MLYHKFEYAGAVILGDCIPIMRDLLKEGSVDIILTDPPYGIKYSGCNSDLRKTITHNRRITNDDKPYLDWIAPAVRVLKDGGRLLCFAHWRTMQQYIDEITKQGLNVRNVLVWDKVNHSMGDVKTCFAPSYEMIIYATKGRWEFQNGRQRDLFTYSRSNGVTYEHPTTKPVNLLEELIACVGARDAVKPFYPSKDEIVLDPFCGSGSSLLAAFRQYKKFIGIEIERVYFELTIKNIKYGTSLKGQYIKEDTQ